MFIYPSFTFSLALILSLQIFCWQFQGQTCHLIEVVAGGTYNVQTMLEIQQNSSYLELSEAGYLYPVSVSVMDGRKSASFIWNHTILLNKSLVLKQKDDNICVSLNQNGQPVCGSCLWPQE